MKLDSPGPSEGEVNKNFQKVLFVVLQVFQELVVVVQSLIHVPLFAIPLITACQASLSFIIFQSLLKIMSIESVMLSNHLTLCHPHLLMSSIFPNIRVFFNEPACVSIGTSASVLPGVIQGWFPLGLTGLVSLKSKILSRVFSSIKMQRPQFFNAQLSLWSNSHIHTWLLEKP